MGPRFHSHAIGSGSAWVLKRVLPPAVACAVGFALLTAWPGEASEAFRDTPQFEIWGFFVAAQFACWTAGFVFLKRWFDEIRTIASGTLGSDRSAPHLPVWTAIGILVILLGTLWASYAMSDFLESPLRWHEQRISIQVVFGTLAASPGLGALSLLSDLGQQVRTQHDSADDHARNLVESRRLVDKIVVLLGALIALTVLATSALHSAMDAERGPENDFEAEYVLLTGLILSATLGVLVAMATAGLDRWANRIVDAVENPVSITDEQWPHQSRRRRELEDRLTKNVGDQFSQLAAILAPLISATASVAV